MTRENAPLDINHPIKRLCGEIQLFELCDLGRCNHKDGRFCTNSDLLLRFERIADEDDVQKTIFVACDEGDEDTESCGEDDHFGDDGEDEHWEED